MPLPQTARVAVVTGANKGVGFHIAQQLVTSGMFGTVILACRDQQRGEAAAAEIGGCATYMPLEVGNSASMQSFADQVMHRVCRLDVLVNNAAIAFKASDPTPFALQTTPTLDINLRGTLELTERLLPLLRSSDDGRIVNVASMAGRLGQLSRPLQAQFTAPDLTTDGVRHLVARFERDVASGTHKVNGWGNSNYGLSKLALIAATRVLANCEPQLKVNACCPGYCDTDMSSHRGTRPPAVGARNAVILVTSPRESCPTGAFYQNEKPSGW